MSTGVIWFLWMSSGPMFQHYISALKIPDSNFEINAIFYIDRLRRSYRDLSGLGILYPEILLLCYGQSIIVLIFLFIGYRVESVEKLWLQKYLWDSCKSTLKHCYSSYFFVICVLQFAPWKAVLKSWMQLLFYFCSVNYLC